MFADESYFYDELNYQVFEVASKLKTELSHQGFLNDEKKLYDMLNYIVKNYVTFSVYENEEEVEDENNFCDDYEYF